MATASSVSRHGFVWTFDTTYTVGQFANGDYWVLDPGSGVTLNSVTPNYTSVGWHQHGMMSNPIAGTNANDGFDSTTRTFDSSLNIADTLPATFSGGTSLVKAESQSSQSNVPQLLGAGILTVVSTTPSAGDFRPPYCGTDKSLNWNISDLDYTKLHSLAQPNSGTNVPAISVSEGSFERAWIEINTEWTGRHLHPQNNQPDYGREMALAIGEGLLQLQLNYSNAAKETLLIRMVQYGIDIYGAAVSGAVWKNNGGHNHGRKAVLLLAAHVLGDSNILAYGDKSQHFIFGEDQQTFVVAQSDVDDCPKYSGDKYQRECYTSSMIGTPEWGEKHNSAPNRDGSNWWVAYRNIVGNSLIGGPLSMQMMGLTSQWNWPPLFDYMDRLWTIEEGTRSNSTDKIHLFEADMWDEYRYIGAPAASTKIASAVADLPGGVYSSTQGLTFTEAANTTTYYTLDGSTPDNTDTEYTGSISISSTTTVKWITYDDTATLNPSDIQESLFTIACVTPVVSPDGGNFESIQTVTITTTTPGATIYYTLDDSDPDNTDIVYSGSFQVGVDTTVKAIAIKSGLSDSSIQSVFFSINSFSPVADDWLNLTIPSESNIFSYQFTATPQATTIDGLVSFSETSISNPLLNTDFDENACTIRFFQNNQIEVRNGSSYSNDIAINYIAGNTYTFEVTVNISSHTYTVTCTPEGSAPQIIASNYNFRTEQSSVSSLANVSMWFGEDQDLTPSDGFTVTNLFKVKSVPPIRSEKALIETIV